MKRVRKKRFPTFRKKKTRAPHRKRSFQSVILVSLIAIIACGLWFRIGGIRFYLPPAQASGSFKDETQIVKQTAMMFRDHTLDPRLYMHPNIMSDYMDAVAFKVVSAVRFRMPVWQAYVKHRDDFYVIARVMTALLGTLMILIAYLIGSRFRRSMGMYAALIFTLFVPFISYSTFASNDVVLTFFVLLSLYFIVRYMESKTALWLVLASVSVGMASIEKYTGVFCALPLALSVISVRWNDRRLMVRELLLAGISYFFTVILLFPWLLLTPQKILAALHARTSLAVSRGRIPDLGLPALILYCTYLWHSLGWIFVLLSGLGTIAFARKYGWKILPLLLGVSYLALLLFVPYPVARYTFPVLLTPLLLSAYGLTVLQDTIVARMKKMKSVKLTASLVTFVIAVLLFPSGMDALTVRLKSKLPYTVQALAGYEHEQKMTPKNTSCNVPLSPSPPSSSGLKYFIVRTKFGGTPTVPAFAKPIASFGDGCDPLRMQDIPSFLRTTQLGQVMELLRNPAHCSLQNGGPVVLPSFVVYEAMRHP